MNQFSVSFSRMYIPLGNPTAGGNYPTKAGITGLPPGIASSAMPDINFARQQRARSVGRAPTLT